MPEAPKVLIVGGVEDIVQGNFGRKLQEAGVEVGWHQAHDTVRFHGIPEACEGLIIIISPCGHQLSNPAREEAKAKGLPWVPVTRKWSDAEPRLRAVGILPAATNGQVLPNNDEQARAIAGDYVRIQRESGRNPKPDEVAAILKRVFGPNYQLTEETYKQVMRDVRDQPVIMAPPDEEPVPVPEAPAPVPPVPSTPEDIRVAVRTVLDEHPEQATRMGDILQAMDGLVVAPDPAVVMDEASKVRLEWLVGDLAKRDVAITAWTHDVLRAVQRGERSLPRQGDFNKEGKALFGVHPPWPIIQQVRKEVFGAWAGHLLRYHEAVHYFEELEGGTREEFDEAIRSGKIPSIPQGDTCYTSKMAIDEYVGNLPGREEGQRDMDKQQYREMTERLARIEEAQKTLQGQLTEILQALRSAPAPSGPPAPGATTDPFMQLLQGGQVRLVVEPVPNKG
jgi:hypothetical protein